MRENPDPDRPVVDFGSHFLADEIARVDSPASDHVSEVSSDPGQYLQWFRDGGIDRAVLSHPYYMGHDVLDETVERNDYIFDIVESYDEYYGLAALPVGAGGEEAAAEFERCVEKGFHGGALTTTVGGRDLTDPVFEPVFEVADRTGAPILVHPTVMKKLQANPSEYVLDEKYQINNAIGREGLLCESIIKVVHEGVFERYPNLTLVYHHLGGNIANMMGRIDLRYSRDWDDETLPFDEFKDRLEDRLYIDTSGYYSYNAPLRAALEQFPASNILLGTDAPAEPKMPSDLEEYVTTVRESTPRSQARQILGQNALDIMVNT